MVITKPRSDILYSMILIQLPKSDFGSAIKIIKQIEKTKTACSVNTLVSSRSFNLKTIHQRSEGFSTDPIF